MTKRAPTETSTADVILSDWRTLGNESLQRTYKKACGDKVLGIKMGDVRAMAKRLGVQHDLGLALWETGYYETRVLATLVMDVKKLKEADCVRLAESCDAPGMIDKLGDALEKTSCANKLRDRWLDASEPLLARAGWNLMSASVQVDKKGAMDFDGLIATIEAELPTAPFFKKEAMNQCLVMIGVYHSDYTEKAIAAGTRLGKWDDRPVPKGCYSSYPPEWIPAAIRLREARK